MDSMAAFMTGEANRNRELMVFDWDKAARIIKERGATEASAGLSGDWEYTGGTILIEGEPITGDSTYLASTWATPEIEIDGVTIDCYLMASDVPKEWGTNYASIQWPESARMKLKA